MFFFSSLSLGPLCLVLAELVTSNGGITTASSLPRFWGRHPTLKRSLSIRGGAIASTYALQLEAVKANVLQSAMAEMDELRRQVVDQGQVIADFGQVAETLCQQALEEFAASAPDAAAAASKSESGSDPEVFWDASSGEAAAAYDAKLTELELALDAPLQLLFYKQLSYIREQALQRYRTAIQTDSSLSEFEAMSQADAVFVRMANEATRESAMSSGGSSDEWDSSKERAFLQSILNQMASTSRQASKVKQDAVLQHQSVMQFLQQQQQMIQQLQMQLYGQSSPWNVGVAYRIPDTNFNLQGTYQQGRANVQLSCVPDEYAPFLGPNGFTNGVGPGNLGLSVNLSI